MNGPLRLATALVTALLALTSAPFAQALRGIELPPGEVAVSAACRADGVIVAVRQAEGFAIRRITLPVGELEVLSVPRTLASASANATVELSAGGTALALFQPAEPGTSGTVRLYTVGERSLDEVNLRQLPRDFSVVAVALAPDGARAYVVAEPYSEYQQQYSVGRLDLPSGRFSGVVLKNNVDLIEQLEVSGERLVLRARGYRGEYPSQPILALHDVASNETSILHAAADGLELSALADGTVLVGGASTWLLLPAEARVTAARPPAGLLAATPDGAWLAALTDGRDAGLRVTGPAGATFSARIAGRGLCLAADGSYAVVITRAGDQLVVFELPR